MTLKGRLSKKNSMEKATGSIHSNEERCFGLFIGHTRQFRYKQFWSNVDIKYGAQPLDNRKHFLVYKGGQDKILRRKIMIFAETCTCKSFTRGLIQT